MSWGGILGGIAGGIIGFFVGGPMGAVYGFGLGAGLGMMVDPITPDMPTIGAPDPQSQAMSSTIGDPVPDLCGTAKITGHLLAYGKERVVEITETQEVQTGKGGGGGSQTQTYVVGYEYYMTWVLGICTGPVNTLWTVFSGEEIVWEGELKLADAVNGQESITLDGIGSCTFYFGTDNQIPSPVVAGIIPNSDYNTPYRNFCYVVLNNGYIGGYPRTPTLKFMITKVPEFSFSSYNYVQTYDCNPAHAMWYILANLTNLPESWLHDYDFGVAALALRNEYKGISILLNKQQDSSSYLETINTHIDNVLLFKSDGKLHPKLFRGNYDSFAVPLIDDSTLLEQPIFNRKSWNDTVNEVKVQYTEIINVERDRTLYGQVFWCGANGYYRVVHDGNTLDQEYELTPLRDIEHWEVKTITGALSSLYLIKTDGTMWARGNNSYGKLGIGNDTLRPPWTEVTGGPWESVHGVSSFNNAARDVNGYVYYTGYNRNVADYMHIGYIGDSRIFRREVDNKIWRHYDLADTTRLGVSEFLTHNTAPITNPEAGPSTFGGGHTLPGSGFTSASDLRGWLSLPLSGSNIVDVQGANASAFVGVGTPNEFYIYGNGLNAAGRLGLGFFGDGVGNPTARVWTWSQSLGGPWKNFSAGYTGTMAAIKSDGTLWTWGDNSYGTLGIGDFENRHTPTQVGNKNNWVKVSCGAGVMAALNAEGEIWSCGSNEHGHCGILDGGMFVNTLTRETTHGIWTDVYCKVTSGILALR